MSKIKVSIWEGAQGWCVNVEGEPAIYVFQTKRQALNYVEKILDQGDGDET